MSNCKVDLTDCDDKIIAQTLRKNADRFDPWHRARFAAIFFLLGAATVAAMDYGDLWICVGDCNGKLPEPPALIAEGE